MPKSRRLPEGLRKYTGEALIVKGVGGTVVAPVAKIKLCMEGKEKTVNVAVTKEMPVEGFDLLLGNDLGSAIRGPLWDPEEGDKIKVNVPEIDEMMTCDEWKKQLEGKRVEAQTRAMRKREEQEAALEGVSNLFLQGGTGNDGEFGEMAAERSVEMNERSFR